MGSKYKRSAHTNKKTKNKTEMYWWDKKYYGRSWENYVKEMEFDDHIQ